MTSPTIQRALISVSDKLGLADFARGLAAAGVQIYSTGGTAAYLARIRRDGPRCLAVHRFSGNDGRAAQDAASQGVWRHSLPPRS